MKESEFNKKFVNAMKARYPNMHGWKIHGHDMQVIGIPDNIYCINGKFVGIEFKIQRDGRVAVTKSFKRQVYELSLINDAKGIALLIAYDETKEKILIRKTRLDWKNVKSHIDWDFEFSKYENAIDIIHLMIEE